MDTIFAPITANAKSAVIVIRISGSEVKKCLFHLGIKKDLSEHKEASKASHQTTLRKLIDPKTSEVIDQALVTFFNNPHSFTGEDVAEIAIHGSPYIAKKVTDLLLELKNVRLAEAGEFSKRAFLNGKLDLVQAEAIVDLIESETEAQHKQALRQLQGELGEIYNSWTKELISITANIEAFIDFPDEDLPADIIDDLENRIANLCAQIKEHLDDNRRGEKIRQGLSLVIVGAPNVGKSSLINYLAKSEVAIVSEIAGTTRDVVNVHLNIAGAAVIISDTAGIREAKDSIEQEGIKRALAKSINADLKILVLDASNIDESRIDQNLLKIAEDKNSIVLINKIDLSPNINLDNVLKHCFGQSPRKALGENLGEKLGQNSISISIQKKINLEKLLQKLEELVKNLVANNSFPPITRARYRKSLNIVLENLLQFSLTKNIEFAAEDLRLAIREIGKITGKVEVDDILDVIFSGFCIGK